MSPLAMACLNSNIPVSVVELLLQKGANPLQTHLLNNRPITILEDVERNIEILGSERVTAIRELFRKMV